MVWGGYQETGTTLLYLILGNLVRFRKRNEILKPQIIPTLYAMGPGVTLQEGSATLHCARVVRNEMQHQSCISRLSDCVGLPDFTILRPQNIYGTFLGVKSWTVIHHLFIAPNSSNGRSGSE